MAAASNLYAGAQKNALSNNIPSVQDPRLHSINNGICSAIERVRAHTQGFHLKADAIVGTAPTGNGESSAPTPVPNGVLDQIEMTLRTLSDALDDLADAERRFNGLA